MQKQNQKPNFEFVAMMAALMSIVALAIDAILPAISNIGEAINSTDPTDNQLLVTMIFLGLGLGQLFFGPISDSFGRKPVVYVGFVIFLVASIICLYAPSLEIMVVGRILQGIGLSAPRTISISIIRDTYEGDYMAKIMSFVVAFFILVPVVAPAIGKLILDAAGWKAIFYVQLVFVLIVAIWFWKRQKETLHPQYKIPFTKHVFIDGVREFIKHRETVAFTLTSGLVTGAFLVYLSSAQHIFEDQYALKEMFPYIFAGLAISIGLSTFLNGTLVMRFGMRKLSLMATIAFCVIAILYSILFLNSPNPSIYILVGFLSIQFFCLGFMWGNFRSIAMEPIGHIAGIGAAINGFVSTLLSIPIATFIGEFVKDTVWPLFAGLAICGLCALTIFLWVNKPKRKRVATT
ncbi:MULTISPECIES: multidrug effflux MFS transporter [Flavobacteriaceae]|jgi:DHA1 family bicyclomycin/chloramphenicol resistance-like MFS transporter|uniref:Bcr/CflA family drug resistance efflux transporter n=1 Tax=Flagellimonas marinaquae TaxID=254955 RepID=A0AA48KRL8_9FLAO|nr:MULTISPECIES: multidrug effflux MFS transporter [Allomuricauda]MCA0957750.1 multidrug effflux MFS transporter [Allomuricauda ruestringensis]USD24411.1 multidrug effflux MFS transporter [Allomuricauda aquimarina]BDW93276.1 Bcr/CflA family drug resistance efflux transporter [Allomuricauda aquimarina]